MGAHATRTDNHIEDSSYTSADRGIDFARNIIIRNTCLGNTINWVIAAISGSSAPSSLGSGDPNGNFSY